MRPNHPNRSREALQEREKFYSAWATLFPCLNYEPKLSKAWRDMQDLSPTNRTQLIEDLMRAVRNKLACGVET